MYNLNHLIVIVFNCTRAYAQDYIPVCINSQSSEKIQLNFN